MANAGYDFIWTEMQHDQRDWQATARMWRTCAQAKAVPGVRIAYTDEREIQHALDAGALVLVVPTVDTVEEAREVVDWAYFPPMGRRSNGGGQAFDAAMWGGVPGGYRNTINDNLVVILMIETLEGLKNAEAIAKVPGVTGIFAASGDLANFTGYRQGDPDYERAINIVHDAALAAGVRLCGPFAWRDRPDFTCFQNASETALIARGAAAELGRAGQHPGQADRRPLRDAALGGAEPLRRLKLRLRQPVVGRLFRAASRRQVVPQRFARAAERQLVPRQVGGDRRCGSRSSRRRRPARRASQVAR